MSGRCWMAAACVWAALAQAGPKDLTRKVKQANEKHQEEISEAAEGDEARDPAELVRQLGEADPAVRDAAQEALMALGEKAGPALREGALSKDPEIRSRSRAVLRDAPLRAVTVTIAAPKAAFKMGEPVAFTHAFTNAGPQPVLLLKALDGSAEGWRGPQISLEVKDASGMAVPQEPEGGRCGNMNQLQAADFLELGPGETADPLACGGAHHPLRVPGPGRYAVTLVYRLREPFQSNPDLNGPVAGAVPALEARLPRGELRSNTLTIEFSG